MLLRKSLLSAALLLTVFTFAAPAISAKPNEYDAIANHLKSKYKAKKVHIPLMWLARFAIKMAKPAGVKSFNITLFENLKFSKETLDTEMQEAMKRSFTADWSSIFHIRSRDGQQAYMYMREDGKNVKIALVTIDKDQAALIRATFSPEKLADFINDPKIFGISLGDDKDNDQGKGKSAPAGEVPPGKID